MISFVRGPGGVVSRLLAEFVPLLAGLVCGAFVLPLTALPWAIITLVVVWIAVSALLRVVRRRPALRRVYRLAVLAHVLFWSALGITATNRAGPGETAETNVSGWRMSTGFRAGYATQIIIPPARSTLAGWGTRPRRVTYPPFAGFGVLGRLGRAWMGAIDEPRGARRPLFERPQVLRTWPEVRALVVRPDAPDAGAPIAIARVDLVASDAELARAVHAAVADLGFRPEGVLVAATHTHSSPGGFSRQPFSAVAGTDHFDPAAFAAIRDAAARAIRAAYDRAVRATVRLAIAHDRGDDGKPILARSRRKEAPDQIDDRVYVVRFDENTTEARPIAALVNYAIHPVLVRRRYMGWHRDLAGAIEHAFTERLDRTPVMFLNGACGDIAPRDDRLAGDGREHLLAARFADAVVPALRAQEPGRSLHVAAARVRQPMGDPHLVLATGSRADWLEAHGGPIWSGGAGALASNLLALPVNALIWSLGTPEMRVGFRWDGSVGTVINLEQHVTEHALPFGALVFSAGTHDFALLCTPGEGTQAHGKALREQARAQGFEHALVVSWTNGSAAYITTDDEYRADTYEARGSVYGPRAGSVSQAALEAALEAARDFTTE